MTGHPAEAIFDMEPPFPPAPPTDGPGSAEVYSTATYRMGYRAGFLVAQQAAKEAKMPELVRWAADARKYLRWLSVFDDGNGFDSPKLRKLLKDFPE